MGTLNTAVLVNPLGSNPNASKSPTPTILIYGDGGAAVYQCFVDGQDIGQWHANQLGQVYVSCGPLGDGAHTLTFQELAPRPGGPPGNPCIPYAFSVDTKPPAAPTILQASAIGPDVNGKYTIRASGTADATARAVKVYAFNVYPRLVGGSGVYGGTWSSASLPQAPGTYVLTAMATDEAGNQSVSSQPVTLTAGTVQPPQATVPGVLTLGSDSVVASRKVTLWWGAPPDGGSPITGYVIRRNGTVIGHTTTNGYSETVDGPGPDGYTGAAVNAVGEAPQSPEIFE
jgi:large repetitive protein